jgi:hypothetical protein
MEILINDMTQIPHEQYVDPHHHFYIDEQPLNKLMMYMGKEEPAAILERLNKLLGDLETHNKQFRNFDTQIDKEKMRIKVAAIAKNDIAIRVNINLFYYNSRPLVEIQHRKGDRFVFGQFYEIVKNAFTTGAVDMYYHMYTNYGNSKSETKSPITPADNDYMKLTLIYLTDMSKSKAFDMSEQGLEKLCYLFADERYLKLFVESNSTKRLFCPDLFESKNPEIRRLTYSLINRIFAAFPDHIARCARQLKLDVKTLVSNVTQTENVDLRRQVLRAVMNFIKFEGINAE